MKDFLIKCEDCEHCTVYENNITTDKDYCTNNEHFISDVEQDYCSDYTPTYEKIKS